MTTPASETNFDVARARRETPGCQNVVHFNNAGAALPPRVVTEAMIEHLELEAAIGGYEAAEMSRAAVQRSYTAVAQLIGCGPEDVAVVENATRGWDMAFYGFDFKPGDRILTGRSEYASNALAFLQVARRTGAVLEIVDDDDHGQTSVEDLNRRLDDGGAPVRLVAVAHVPSHGGLVNPVQAIGRVTKERGIPYVVDACQSVGQLHIDVEEIGCDVLSATGRKFLRGPRGIGFLYVSPQLRPTLEPPFLDLHAAAWVAPDRYVIRADAGRYENFETNYAAKIGLGVAANYALAWGPLAIERRVVALGASLRRQLREVPAVEVHDRGERQCGIVTFTIQGKPAAAVSAQLAARRINTSISRVKYAPFDLPDRVHDHLMRASVHYYNTDEEVAALTEAVATIAATT